jgi:tRNA pseudouridine13 synthase
MDSVLDARNAALAPPYAYGGPVATGVLRAAPQDFLVEEDLGFAPAGSGQHLLLRVRKTNANTQWVAGELARLSGCSARDVGYAGLKDRRAIATQWFSVPRPRAPLDWSAFATPEFEVLEAHPHHRKLPRGALAGNRFAVRIGALGGDGTRLAALLAPQLDRVGRGGVPNYFGPQRFGRDGANLARVGEGAQALRRSERGFVISAARSALFNAVLGERVRRGCWNHLLEGDLANLDGRGSVFAVTQIDENLAGRVERLEVHPTGTLWGRGTLPSRGAVLEIESAVAERFGPESRLCERAGLRQERRSLRLTVREPRCEVEAEAVVLRFSLTRGGFATAVLRELVATATPWEGRGDESE